MIELDRGRWNPTALKRAQRVGHPSWHAVPGRAYSMMWNDQCIAAVRQRGRLCWQVKIEGFEFRVTPEMPTARFRIEYTPVRSFPTSLAARAEAHRVMREARSASLLLAMTDEEVLAECRAGEELRAGGVRNKKIRVLFEAAQAELRRRIERGFHVEGGLALPAPAPQPTQEPPHG